VGINMAKYPLTPEEFKYIYTKVPRLNVEIIVKSHQGVLLTKRAIYPSVGQWHIPGGTVWYNEPIFDAVKRIASKEVGLNVENFEVIGLIEYPSLDKDNYGDPRGIAVLITEFSGNITIDEEASDYGWFKSMTDNMLLHQDEFLLEHQLLTRE
jgi:ADP-ribose pyrophosphatase YjhB (NUDIX family)